MKMLANKVVLACIVGLAAFAALYLALPPRSLIVILNGLLAGVMVALFVLFVPFVWAAVKNDGIFDRGRQFGLGSFLMSMSIAIGLCVSIYIHATDTYSSLFMATAFGRWMAIWGGILKVTAPDFGSELLYGRDRKTLVFSTTAGVIIALVVIWLQDTH